MCSQYSSIDKITAKYTIRGPNRGEKRYARLSEQKDRNVPCETQWANNWIYQCMDMQKGYGYSK